MGSSRRFVREFDVCFLFGSGDSDGGLPEAIFRQSSTTVFICHEITFLCVPNKCDGIMEKEKKLPLKFGSVGFVCGWLETNREFIEGMIAGLVLANGIWRPRPVRDAVRSDQVGRGVGRERSCRPPASGRFAWNFPPVHLTGFCLTRKDLTVRSICSWEDALQTEDQTSRRAVVMD